MALDLLSHIRSRQQYVPPPRAADGLGARVASSSVWSILGIGAGTALQLVRSMVFARLLLPADFGVINLANAFAQFVMIFANFGFTASVIHHDDLKRTDLATLWWGNVAVDTSAALLCCLVAAISGHVTHNPKLLPIMILLASQFVVTSFGSVSLALMQRTFRFRETAITDLIGAVLTFGLGYVLIAVFHMGVYGLVLAMVLATAATALLNFAWMPWLPSFTFSREALKTHFGYGRWFLGVSLVSYVNGTSDRFALGHMLNTTQLGYYEYAGNIPLQIVTKIAWMLNTVLFSAFSSARHSAQQMQELLQKFYRFSAIATFPVLVGIALVAPEFVQVAYGDVWRPIIPAVRLFCLYGALLLYTQPLYSICNGIGQQHLPFRWMVIYLPINLVLIWMGIHFGGLNGVVLVRSFMPLFVAFTLGRQVMRMLDVPWSALLRATIPAAVSCLAMAVAVKSLEHFLLSPGISPLPHLLLASGIGAVVYGGVLMVFWPGDVRRLWMVVARRQAS